MNPLDFLQQNWFLVAIGVAVLLLMRDPNNPISKALGIGRPSLRPQPQPGFTPTPQMQMPPQFQSPGGWTLPPNAQVGQVFQLGPNGLVPVPEPAPISPPPAPVTVQQPAPQVVVEEIPLADLDDSMELEFVPTGLRLVDAKRGLKLKFTTGADVPPAPAVSPAPTYVAAAGPPNPS
jgi:hypothetical protein